MRSKMILYRFNENENHRGVNLASWGNFLGYLKKVDSTHGHISLHIPKFECKYHSMYWNYIKWYNDRAKILSAFRKIFKKVEQIFYEEKFAFLWIEKFRWASIKLHGLIPKIFIPTNFKIFFLPTADNTLIPP